MKKVENIGIGGRSFIIDEDAYNRLSVYLDNFRSKLDVAQSSEVMDELESRISEIFAAKVGNSSQVVSLSMVEEVVSQLGMPDGSKEKNTSKEYDSRQNVTKKFYRDVDNKAIGGVCSGLAAYFNIDVLLVRIILVALLICASAGFWIYVILWIVAPKAVTAAQKCEMRGWPVTAENMAKVSLK